jgi:uncharacterized membrane protein YgdD (TMEM256/DUF423 family)
MVSPSRSREVAAVSRWLQIASVLGAVGIVLGAFGAHALKARLAAESLASWQTAVQFHLIHAVALLALALFETQSGRSIQLPAWLFSLGIALFSGSIYLLVLTQQRWLGPLTPLGGLCFIAGWLSLMTLARR